MISIYLTQQTGSLEMIPMYVLILCLFDKRMIFLYRTLFSCRAITRFTTWTNSAFKKIKTANSWAVELELAQVVCVSGHYLLIVHALPIAKAWPFSFSQTTGAFSLVEGTAGRRALLTAETVVL